MSWAREYAFTRYHILVHTTMASLLDDEVVESAFGSLLDLEEHIEGASTNPPTDSQASTSMYVELFEGKYPILL